MIGALPDHVPGLAVKVDPSRGVPETVGGDVFLGAVARSRITPVDARASAPPSALRAVTRKMSRRPRSSAVSPCRRDVAPAIELQLASCELQRIHWYVKVIGVVPDQAPRPAVAMAHVSLVPAPARR